MMPSPNSAHGVVPLPLGSPSRRDRLRPRDVHRIRAATAPEMLGAAALVDVRSKAVIALVLYAVIVVAALLLHARDVIHGMRDPRHVIDDDLRRSRPPS